MAFKHPVLHQLNRIAQANDDEFKFEFRIPDDGGVDLIVTERAEGHEFVIGYGMTQQSACEYLTMRDGEHLKRACEAWNYAYVE